MATVDDLFDDAIATSLAAVGARDTVTDLDNARTGNGARRDVALACSGTSCLRADQHTNALEVCEGTDCEPLDGLNRRCARSGEVWSTALQRCVRLGASCDAPSNHPDATAYTFAFDASGNCLATADCAPGHVKHPEDARCVTDCGQGRIFSYVTNACVGVGAPCGDGAVNRVLQAFDQNGRCVPTGECAPGYTPHPSDTTRCVPVCAAGARFSEVLDRCFAEGEACDPPANHQDRATHAFAFDASGNCLATTDCASGHVKHPEDARCVTDCGHERIFSYVMNACVGVGASCGDGVASGFLQAFDERGRCAPTQECAPGYTRHPRDATRCVPVCASGTSFSDVLDRCVAEGAPCPGGAHDAGGLCHQDGAACPATEFPDRGDRALRVSPRTAEQLGGAALAYDTGVCRPTGVCSRPGDVYSWERGGCFSEAAAAIVCPPGFTRTSDTSCRMSRGVGGEGSGAATVSGVDPRHRIRAVYRIEKMPQYRDADYDVSGPGIRGGAHGIDRSHATGGAWVSGASSYTYRFRNNDCQGVFTWDVEK